MVFVVFFFFKQKTAYEMCGRDWSSDVCSSDLGPKGRNVVIQKSFGAPSITKDGVTVAKEVELEDPDRKSVV